MKEIIHIGLAWAPHICSDIRKTLIFDPEDKFDINDPYAIDEFEKIVQDVIDHENRTLLPGMEKIDTITVECNREKTFSELMTPGMVSIIRVCEYNNISLFVRVNWLTKICKDRLHKNELHLKLV